MTKITLPLPPTDNQLYGQRGKVRFMYQAGKDWKEKAWLLIRSQYKGKIIEGDINIGSIVFYLKRWRDIQGSLKLVFDSMEGIVYANDRQIRSFYVVRKIDKSNPRIEITL